MLLDKSIGICNETANPEYQETMFNSLITNLGEIQTLQFLTSCLRALAEYLYLDRNFQSQKQDLIIKKIDNLELKIKSQESFFSIVLGTEKIKFAFKEYKLLCDYIYTFLQNQYTKNYVNIRILNPIYLEHMLGVDLPFLFSTKIEIVKVSDLLIFYKENNNGISEGLNINQSRYYNELRKGNYSFEHTATNHLYENNKQRLLKVLEELKKEKYPKDDNYIILYNDENIVRDGEHRLACLYFLYGDIEIPIRRLYFSHNFYSFSRYYRLHK